MERAKRYEPAEVLAIVLLGLLLRLFAGRNSLTENGILPEGYDEYYHMRRILYTVNHFPSTLWFDSYLDYPHGQNLTWPPLFDQLSAFLSIAFGQHSQHGVETVAAIVVPVAIGVIAIVAVYCIVKAAFNSNIALLSAFMTAISPYYIPMTEIGATDHHGLEVLLFLCSILFLILALSRRQKRSAFAIIAGLMMAALAYTWLGADIYLGIILIYAAVQITYNLKSGVSSKEFTVTFLTAFGVALILVLPFWNASWLHPSFLGMAAAIVSMLLMFVVSKVMLERNINWAIFPLALLAIAGVVIALFAITGSLFNIETLIKSGGEYLFGGEMTEKIAEAQPLFSNSGALYSYSLASSLGWSLISNLLLSLAGLVALAVQFKRKGVEGEGQLLIFTWAVGSLLLTIGQMRFLYLSTIATGILISILFFWALDAVNKPNARGKLMSSKALVPVLLLILIFPTVSETANFSSNVPPIAGDWYESLNWLEGNSNATSFYDNPQMTPEYSVMNFWDCGNWVVYVAKRPVVSDNFQAGVVDSVKFYLASSELASTAILDARRSRYVLVTYNMLFNLLPSMVAWTNEDPTSYLAVKDYGSYFESTPTEKLLNTTMGRLYLFNGGGMGHFRLIYGSHTIVGTNNPDSLIKIFEYVPGALIRVKTGPDQKVGALLNLTSNQGKEFFYINEAVLKDGNYEIRVPYSTESKYETHALGPYMIFSGNDKGIKTQNISVSEEDIHEGKIIDASF